MFDDLYHASWVEVESKSKWKNASPKREITRETETGGGKKTKTKHYVYDQYVPRGEFLSTLLPSGSDLWLRLWRNMLWETLRGIPTTRGVYKERADGKASSEAKKTWDALTDSRRRWEKGEILTEKVVSSLFVGAQDRNAENVPFQGTAENNLLLHFWPIASLTFVPRVIRKNDKLGRYGMEEMGYVLAIPEPASLRNFVADALALLRSLDTERSGIRPRSALITVPEESGLEYLLRLAGSRIGQEEISYSLVGIEIYHLEKRGNSIPTLASARLSPSDQVLREYDSLRKDCRNPLYRSQRIRNLLSGTAWYAGMDSVFNQYPWEFFVFSQEKTPGTIPFFGYDTVRKFRSIEIEVQNSIMGGDMSGTDQEDRLAMVVHRLVREYANRRTEEKSGEKYEDFKIKKDDKGRIIYPKKYADDREDICRDAFLAMRGRGEQDFVEYFTGTICSVAQYLPEDDYLVVSRALMTQPETVKTLSMLAVSAVSSVGRTGENAV